MMPIRLPGVKVDWARVAQENRIAQAQRHREFLAADLGNEPPYPARPFPDGPMAPLAPEPSAPEIAARDPRADVIAEWIVGERQKLPSYDGRYRSRVDFWHDDYRAHRDGWREEAKRLLATGTFKPSAAPAEAIQSINQEMTNEI